MDVPARIQQELLTRCVWLRTKASYLPMPGPLDPENVWDTAVWWCLKTHGALGPDDHTACPADCGRPGRPCYEPPVTL
jgi:hypothetical protein